MSKQPAFLLFSKDWLQGTAEMTAVEKGVFIDLLCHQHQSGTLPGDPARLARLACMSLDEFTPIWNSLQAKFIAIGEANASAIGEAIGEANASATVGRLVNMKLTSVMGETKEKAKQNRIIAIWSQLLKKCALSKKEIDLIRKSFKVSDFIKIQEHELSERMSEWFSERIKNIEDANGDGNEDANANGDKDRKGGVGERKDSIPKIYDGREVFVPGNWPKEEFTKRWNAYREFRWTQHRFAWKSPDSEQKAIQQLFNETQHESFEFVLKCMDFCEGKAWKGIFPNLYREQLNQTTTTTEKHNDFSKKQVPV